MNFLLVDLLHQLCDHADDMTLLVSVIDGAVHHADCIGLTQCSETVQSTCSRLQLPRCQVPLYDGDPAYELIIVDRKSENSGHLTLKPNNFTDA